MRSIISGIFSDIFKSDNMQANRENRGSLPQGRVNSIDFFRGLTMFLLAGESTHIYRYLRESDSSVIQFLGIQFSHHQWHGLHFWDLIQLELGGSQLLNKIFTPFVNGLFSWTTPLIMNIITSLAVWAALWYLCYWLFKKRLFIRI